jgi:hypothetical protein
MMIRNRKLTSVDRLHKYSNIFKITKCLLAMLDCHGMMGPGSLIEYPVSWLARCLIYGRKK